MRVFTVHEPPRPPQGKLERAERLVFVRDGFSWAAAILAPIWMLYHRMWLVLIGYIVLQVALELSLTSLGAAPQWLGAAFLAIHIALGFEASTLQRWTLARKGWRTLGVTSGRSTIDAERRFFEAWVAEPDEADVSPSKEAAPAEEPVAKSFFRQPWRRLFGAQA